MNNISFLINNEALSNLEPRKLKLLVDMLNDMGEKNTEEKIQLLFAYHIKMKQSGLQFTSSETSAILDAVKETITPTERAKLETLGTMLGIMHK